MRIVELDHINIVGSLEVLERCVAFYTGVLGLTSGPRPPFRSRGFWLYAGNRALVHLTEGTGGLQPVAAFNHIAFACEDLEAARDRLAKHGIPYQQSAGAGRSPQLFLTDPAGIQIELTFRDE